MPVGRSLAWMGASQALAVGLQFAAQVVLARFLTLREAGIYAVALAVAGALSLIQTLGLQALIVREEALTAEVKATAFTINALISVLLSLAIAGAAALGGRAFGDPGVGRTLMVLSVAPLIPIASFLPASMLEREGRFRAIALAGTAGSVAGAAATIVLLALGFSYLSAAYAQWANAGAAALLLIWAGRRHARPRLGLRAWRRVADFGFQMLAVTGVNSLSLRLSDILLARFLGLGRLGLFSRAGGLNAMLWTNVHLVIGRVMLVDFADVHRGGGGLRDRYVRTVDAVTLVLWPVFAGLAVLAAPFLFVVYGPRWTPAAVPLALLAASSMVLVAITMTWEVFAATGELRAQTRVEVVRSVVALAAFAGGCLISIEAAAAARVVDALFAVALYRPHLDRLTGSRLADLLPVYRRNALLTGVAVGPAALVMGLHGWSPATPIVPLGASVAAGGVLWLAALVATRHPAVADLRRPRPAAA